MAPFTGFGHQAKIYTVNGGVAPGQNQPDWLGSTITRAHRERAKKKKKNLPIGTEGKSLIQDFDFPEASNKIKSTSDGKYLIATGTYKPRMKVYELDELALKFDRVTDSENVDFCILSTDWTKTLHLQSDRTLDIHTQTASHYRIRIPRHGRALAYHFPSCDAICGGAGSELWRLNLEEGRFLTPFQLSSDVAGINAIDINPVHGLISLGTETESGQGTVEFWDHRARSRAGILRLPYSKLSGSISGFNSSDPSSSVAVTALASRLDGLTTAVGTSTGHTLLYDLRSPTPHTTKDQGYGLPIKKIEWPTSVAVSGFDQTDGLVASADSKIIKIWSRHTTDNLLSLNPVASINDMHIYPESGLILLANEASPMSGYFVPSLGPAPKWCRFLENMTEEMEESKEVTIYDDYKFVSDNDLKTLSLDHLIGTPALRPYMHGYFIDLRLYAKAKAIANPFAYIEHRDKLIKERLEKEQESRIRTSKVKAKTSEAGSLLKNFKINKGLAQRIMENDEGSDSEGSEDQKIKTEQVQSRKKKLSKKSTSGPTRALLDDDRFGDLFTNEDFEIDETSREFAALNPSSAAAAAKKRLAPITESDSNLDSEDGIGEEEGDEASDSETEDNSSDDDIWKKSHGRKSDSNHQKTKIQNPTRTRGMISAPQEQYQKGTRMIIDDDLEDKRQKLNNKRPKTIGQKLKQGVESTNLEFSTNEQTKSDNNQHEPTEIIRTLPGGGMEISFVKTDDKSIKDLKSNNDQINQRKSKKQPKVEMFGIGLSKGKPNEYDDHANNQEGGGGIDGENRNGRIKRRSVLRSASKTKMRSL